MKRSTKRFLKVSLSIIAVLIMLSAFFACENPASSETDFGPKFVAHRGFSHEHVGNTEESFRAAAGMGFYGIETDIRKTKDGYYVCNHDATVAYADGTEKGISAATREELLSKPLKNDKTQGDVYLCTFETYLQVCKECGKVAVIELKDYFSKKEIRGILEIVDKEYDRKKVSFISFYYLPLSYVKKEDPSIEQQYLSQSDGDTVFEKCLSEGVSIDVKYTILTEELVQTFHDAGLKVNVWTVDELPYLDLAYQYGVDYITTDLFDRYPEG